jgi:hypothetical protein
MDDGIANNQFYHWWLTYWLSDLVFGRGLFLLD